MSRSFLGSAGLIASLLMAGVSCGSAHADTLSTALRNAHAHHPRLLAERARQSGDSFRLPQAQAGFYPTANLTAGRGTVWYGSLGGALGGSSGRANPSNTYGITLSQPLFDGMRTVNEVQRARAEITAGASTLLSVESQILVLAAEAYLRVLRDREVLRLRRENLATLRSDAARAVARRGAGDISRTALDQARTRGAEAETDAAAAAADLAIAEQAYATAIGRRPGALAPVRFPNVRLPASVDAAFEIARRHNPAVQAAHAQAAAASHAVGVSMAALLPTVALEASHQFDDTNEIRGSDRSAQTAVRVRVNVPIDIGRGNVARVEQATQVHVQRTHEVADQLNQARRAVAAAFEGVRGARARAAAAQRRVGFAREALRGLNVEFEAGQIELVQVLDGRRELVNARVSAAQIEFDERVALVNLLGAMGRLAVDSFESGRGDMALGGAAAEGPTQRNGRPVVPITATVAPVPTPVVRSATHPAAVAVPARLPTSAPAAPVRPVAAEGSALPAPIRVEARALPPLAGGTPSAPRPASAAAPAVAPALPPPETLAVSAPPTPVANAGPNRPHGGGLLGRLQTLMGEARSAQPPILPEPSGN